MSELLCQTAKNKTHRTTQYVSIYFVCLPRISSHFELLQQVSYKCSEVTEDFVG